MTISWLSFEAFKVDDQERLKTVCRLKMQGGQLKIFVKMAQVSKSSGGYYRGYAEWGIPWQGLILASPGGPFGWHKYWRSRAAKLLEDGGPSRLWKVQAGFQKV
jgi:hypothetical protein